MRIAVYSCNFGNHRNELSNGIDHFKFDEKIDYYFFTENKELTSKYWKIIHPSLLESDHIMNSERWTSKHTKFVLPEVLKGYDVVVWCDSKLLNKSKIIEFNKSKNNTLTINKAQIETLFDTGKKLFNVGNYWRKRPQDEIKTVIKCGLENAERGGEFLKEIGERQYKTILFDTCFIIRRTDDETNNLFESIFKLLKLKGLKRDQCVYNHAIDEINYSPEKIGVIKMVSLFNDKYELL